MRFQLIRTYQGHQDRIDALVPIPDQSRLVSASQDGLIKIWNLRSDSSVILRQSTSSYPTALDVFPAGFFIATGLSDGQIEIWNLETAEVIRRFEGHEGRITALAITHSGHSLISASQDRTLRIWDALTGVRLHTCSHQSSEITTLSVTPDDKVVLAGQSGDQNAPGVTRAWQIETGVEIAEFNNIPNSRHYMAALKDGRHAVSGSEAGDIIVWDRQTGESVRHINAHPGPVVMALMPDQKSVVVGTPKPSLALWDLTTGEKTHQFDEPSGEVTSIAVTTDGRSVIAGCQDGSLNFYMRVS